MVRSLADADLDESDRKLLSDIDRVGWHVVMIPEAEMTSIDPAIPYRSSAAIARLRAPPGNSKKKADENELVRVLIW